MPSPDLADPADTAPGADAVPPAHKGVGAGAPDALNVRFAGGESLAGMRYAAAAYAAGLGLTGERLDALVVVVHELAANAVLHGGGRGRLRMWAGDDAVYCEVSDEGPGIGPGGSSAGPAGRTGGGILNRPVSPPPPGYERGRGIFCVQQLADSVHIRTGANGTVVTAAVGRVRD